MRTLRHSFVSILRAACLLLAVASSGCGQQPISGNTPVPRVPGEPIPQELIQAGLYGAKARITLHVVDSKGKDVVGAEVMGSFAGTKNPAELYKVMTDNSGRVTLDAVHAGYMVNLTVSKENYYITRKEHHFDRRDWICVKDGRWIPWNPTLEVILKEKRNPIPMLFTWETKVVIPKGNPIGFDCKTRSLVAPYGTGEIADFTVTYSSNGKDRLNLEKRITIEFLDDSGFIKIPKDTFSQFPSLHEAPNEGYSQKLTYEFSRTPTTILKDEGLQDSEYFIMRSRVKKDDYGRIVSAMYGKFYRFAFDEGDDGKEGYLLLQYAINPTLNDRNIEMAGHYP